MAELHPLTRLAFIGLWTIADFKGCIEWRPKRIKIQVLPYDDHPLETVADELEKAGFVTRYKVNGQPYVKILNFVKHQNPHKNERDSGSDIPDLGERESVENKEDGEKPEKIGSETELIESETEPLVLIPDSLNPLTDTGFLSAETAEAAAPLAPVIPFGQPSKFEHPAIILFEEVFGFKTRSNFATAVSDKVSDLGLWRDLVQNKSAFADKPLEERKKVCNWILDEYDARVEKKNNARPIQNFREQREQEAIASRNILDDIRAELDGANGQLQETDASRGSGFVRALGPKPDDGRESLPC